MRMLERHRDTWPGLSGCATAHGIDDHHDDARRLERLLDVGGGTALACADGRQFLAHRGNQVLRIRHRLLRKKSSDINYYMLTRRDILRASLALAALPVLPQGLGQFSTPTVPCGDVKPTPASADEATFKAGAPLKTSLVEPGMTGERLVLTGTVSG